MFFLVEVLRGGGHTRRGRVGGGLASHYCAASTPTGAGRAGGGPVSPGRTGRWSRRSWTCEEAVPQAAAARELLFVRVEVVRGFGHTCLVRGFRKGQENGRGALFAAVLGGPGHGGEAQPPLECGEGLGHHTDSTICRREPEQGCIGEVC